MDGSKWRPTRRSRGLFYKPYRGDDNGIRYTVATIGDAEQYTGPIPYMESERMDCDWSDVNIDGTIERVTTPEAKVPAPGDGRVHKRSGTAFGLSAEISSAIQIRSRSRRN